MIERIDRPLAWLAIAAITIAGFLAAGCERNGAEEGSGDRPATTAITLDPLPITPQNSFFAAELALATTALASDRGSIVGARFTGQFNLLQAAGSHIDSLLVVSRTPTAPVVMGNEIRDTLPCEKGTVTILWNDGDANGLVSSGDSAFTTYNRCLNQGQELDGAVQLDDLTVTGEPNVAGVPAGYSANLAFHPLRVVEEIIRGSLATFMLEGTATVTSRTDDGVLFTSAVTTTELTHVDLDPSSPVSGTSTIRDYRYEQTHDLSTTRYTWSVSGRLDNSLLGGHVTFETISPFQGNDRAPPEVGVIAIRGKDGTSVTLTIVSFTTYLLDVDLDGDGQIDNTMTVTIIS